MIPCCRVNEDSNASSNQRRTNLSCTLIMSNTTARNYLRWSVNRIWKELWVKRNFQFILRRLCGVGSRSRTRITPRQSEGENCLNHFGRRDSQGFRFDDCIGQGSYDPRIRATACKAAVKSWWVRPPIE